MSEWDVWMQHVTGGGRKGEIWSEVCCTGLQGSGDVMLSGVAGAVGMGTFYRSQDPSGLK